MIVTQRIRLLGRCRSSCFQWREPFYFYILNIICASVTSGTERKMYFNKLDTSYDNILHTLDGEKVVKVDEEIISALKEACAYDFVEKLPEGIYSSIGERGFGFSEGQNQRLSIARALLRNSPILLLDEATSALDVDTERRVLKNIMESNSKRTCIVTTHRPSVLNMCDRVYRICQSRVNLVEQSEVEQMVVDF